MSTTETLKLAGIFRPRNRGPGFGIPVFSHDGQYWVQEVTSEDRVRRFVMGDVEANASHILPSHSDSPAQSAGQQALYAFEATDGTVKLGTREEVIEWLRGRVVELQATPFVLRDVAEFLGDADLVIEAQRRCDAMMQQSRKVTSGTEVSSVTTVSTRAIQWEYDLVERPFCQQLKAMGWQWLEGDTDVPDFTERNSFREVLLKEKLAWALRKLNRRDGHPWLDDVRIARAIRDLEQAAGHRLMEVNQSATELLLKGTVAEGLPDWDHGRPQPVKFVDFENPANNDFLVINQFKVELTSGRGHVIPDAVLFVNGIPLVVAEFKSPWHPESVAGGDQSAPALLEPAPRAVPDALCRERGCRAAFSHQSTVHRQRLLRGSRGHHRCATRSVFGMGGHEPGAAIHGGRGIRCADGDTRARRGCSRVGDAGA